jgi:hypothetical protein
MHRTQIYITEEQERRVAERAADAGVSKAEAIRRVLDQGLGIDDGVAERRAAILATAGAAAAEDDWPMWLRRVRGKGADARLAELGG